MIPHIETAAKPNWRAELIPLAACVVLCVLLSTLPHAIWWVKTGAPVWISEPDDSLVLAIGANAYHEHAVYLSDLLRVSGGDTIYPNLQFIPFVLVAKLARIPPVFLGLLWRLWAGSACSATLYLLLRFFIRRRWVAAAATLVLLFDVGMLSAHLLVTQVITFSRLVLGHGDRYLATNPQIYPHWRILTPSIILPFLFLYLILLFRAREAPANSRIILAGLSFGLMFYQYFYFWPAVGLSLLLAAGLDREHRRTYLSIAVVGSFVGFPSLLYGYLVTRRNPPDWGPRSDLFLRIPHFSELLLPKLTLILVPVTFIWVWRRHRNLLPFWCLALSGLLLEHHQIVTGYQIQNFHWAYIWGSMLSVLLVLCVVGEVKRITGLRPFARPVLFAACVLMVGSGFWLRSVEARRTVLAVELTTGYLRYQDQRLRDPRAVPFAPGAIVAGDRSFVDLAVIAEEVHPLWHYVAEHTPSVTDSELDRRWALNAFLVGLDHRGFAEHERAYLAAMNFGPAVRDPQEREAQFQRQLAAFDGVAVDPRRSWNEFNVRYVALPATQSPPAYLSAGDWHRIENGPAWQIWEVVGRDPESYR